MSDERRDSDSPVVDWSSSPSVSGWERPLEEERLAEPPADQEQLPEDGAAVAEEPPPLSAFTPPPEPTEEQTPLSAFTPESSPSSAAAASVTPAAGAQPATAAQAAAPRKGPGRSAMGILAFIALGGYLVWYAFSCYEGMGVLHRQADRATEQELSRVQRQHTVLTSMLVFNGAVAAPFVLGVLVHLAGKRRLAQFFGLLGLAALVVLLGWTLQDGRDLMSETDMMVRVSLGLAAAWFA